VPRQATSNHAPNVELFDHDDAVALGQSCGLNMQEVLALAPDLSVQTHDAELGLLSPLGPFLSSGNDALRSGKPRHGALVEARIGSQVAVGIGQETGDAAVQGHDRLGAGGWLGQIDLAEDRGKPLVAIAAERAGLRFAFQRPIETAPEGKMVRVKLDCGREDKAEQLVADHWLDVVSGHRVYPTHWAPLTPPEGK
jgi:hypothetical protein